MPSTRRGVDCPATLSVVGFDDMPEAEYFTPPLTTVRQDFTEVGSRGFDLLLDEIESGQPLIGQGERFRRSSSCDRAPPRPAV